MIAQPLDDDAKYVVSHSYRSSVPSSVMSLAKSIVAGLVMFPLLVGTSSRAGPTLLYDLSEDRVLLAEGAEQPWFPASLAKLMTAYVVFDAWKNGKVSRSTSIQISAKANSRPKMRLGRGAGKEITYDEAMSALILLSANDVAVALAEAVSGSEEVFVAEMNATAAKLGMTQSHFINASGLPGEGQFTTAKDLAILARSIWRDFPEQSAIFSTQTAQVGTRTIASHNDLLITVPGGDGMKTGFTCSAGYNIIASATREGKRLIAIVLGEATRSRRNARAAALLERGFQTVSSGTVLRTKLETLPVESYDRELVRAANLDKRFKDCLDPEPTLTATGSGVKLGASIRPLLDDSDQRATKSARKRVVKKQKGNASSGSDDD